MSDAFFVTGDPEANMLDNKTLVTVRFDAIPDGIPAHLDDENAVSVGWCTWRDIIGGRDIHLLDSEDGDAFLSIPRRLVESITTQEGGVDGSSG